MARKKKSPYGWPFSKWRMSWIAEGDRIIAEAADLIGDPAVCCTALPQDRSRFRRAAKLYERSARFYRQAGLGLMAQGSWQDAAECWAAVGDQDQCERCEQNAEAIPEYFSQEV